MPRAKTEPHRNSHELVEQLETKGLVIDIPEADIPKLAKASGVDAGNIVRDVGGAAQELERFGYARYEMYFESRRDPNTPGNPFRTGTTFQHIVRIRQFDEDLREVSFSAVGKFEMVLRTAISEVLGRRFGSHPYQDANAFRSKEKHQETIQRLSDVCMKSHDPRAKQHMRSHPEQPLPPIWHMMELLTFGESSRLLRGVSREVANDVAEMFGLPPEQILEQWSGAFVDLRNICAHHDRLFNRTFQKIPVWCKRHDVPNQDIPKGKLRSLLQCLDHVMTSRGVPVGIEERVRNILVRYPEISPEEAGY